MTHKLIHSTLNSTTTLELSKDKRNVRVHLNDSLVAEFDIHDVWDMIIDAVATLDASPVKEPGLFRRKGEAIAGMLYTHEAIMKDLERRES